MSTAGFSVRVDSSRESSCTAGPTTERSPKPGELRITRMDLDDGRCVVTVAGEMDKQTAPRLVKSLEQVGSSDAPAIIVDLTGCSFIDSSGLGALVGARKLFRASGRQLVLVASGRQILGAFELTGLDSLFKIYPSLATALIPIKESWLDEAERRVSIRDANEQLGQSCVGLGSSGADEFVFICECGDRGCTSLLHLELAEYESVRAHPARFVIARNHENPEAERVVRENGRFAVVETFTGERSKPALESNPRWQRGEPW